MSNSTINIPIFLSSDDNYAPFVATTIASICDNTKSFCEFYILDGGITQENKDKIYELNTRFDKFSIEFINLDLNKYFKGFKETPYITKAMYSRFLIPELKPEIDKAIYSDVDVIFLGDIAEMYNEDLAGCALGAVWEEFNERCENIRRKKQLSLTNSHKYFNSGNLLLDCKKWRKSAIADKLINLHNSLNNNSTTPDQDILNKYFECNYKQLPTRYCWTNQCCNYYTNQNFVIRHFNGPIKPWHINGDKYVQILPNLSDFWHYAKLTSFYKKLHNITTNTQVQLVLTRKLQLQQAVQKQIYKISQKKAIV